MKLIHMNPACHCPYCGCLVVARLDSYGTAQAHWQRCPHLEGFERIDNALHARFTEEKDAAKRLGKQSDAIGNAA
jgi:hypothetical protein